MIPRLFEDGKLPYLGDEALWRHSTKQTMEPIILSDEEDPSTPFPVQSKKRRTEPDPNQTVFLVDDDPTPQKHHYQQRQHGGHSSSTPSFVAETPMSPQCDSDVAIVKCTGPSSHSDPTVRVSPSPPKKFSGQFCNYFWNPRIIYS